MKRSTRRSVLLAALCTALGCLPAAAQESASALKGDELRAEPYADAKAVGRVAKGEALTIVKRQGGWYQVKAGAVSGWIRMLSVRRGQGGQRDVGEEIGGVAGIATGRAGTGQVVSSTGVRGLSEEELKHAKFDEAQIAKAEADRVTAPDAKAFAAQAGLGSRQMAFLPDPKGGRQ